MILDTELAADHLRDEGHQAVLLQVEGRKRTAINLPGSSLVKRPVVPLLRPVRPPPVMNTTRTDQANAIGIRAGMATARPAMGAIEANHDIRLSLPSASGQRDAGNGIMKAAHGLGSDLQQEDVQGSKQGMQKRGIPLFMHGRAHVSQPAIIRPPQAGQRRLVGSVEPEGVGSRTAIASIWVIVGKIYGKTTAARRAGPGIRA